MDTSPGLPCGCRVALIPSDIFAAGHAQRPYIIRCTTHGPSLCPRRRARIARAVDRKFSQGMKRRTH
jgi:hypothetical protein